MKKQSSRRRSASMPPIPVRHQLDHIVPTVIHDPEAKMTALGRLTHHVLQDRKKLSTWAVGIAAGALVLVTGWNFATRGRSTTTEVWSKLDTAKTAEDRVDVAKQYPDSVASTWARLQAANVYFSDAIKDMPNNTDVARPNFKKALDLYDQVAREAPKDSFQKRAAEMGKARSLEARFELLKAIEQYELVVKNWPRSAEAGQARQLAEALQTSEAAAFYKELYQYRPTTVTLPPFGSERFNFPPTGPTTKSNLPGLPSSLSNLPLELAPPTLDLSRPEPAQAKDKTKSGGTISDLPADVFSSKPAAAKEKAPR
ncbi:MAG: tol-pal system YbgF family protein [Isosphaerales bacterium]